MFSLPPIFSRLVDAQTGVLDRVNKTAAEARQAAFAARSQTDPQKYGDLVGETIDGRINDNLVRMARFALELGQQTNVTARTLEKAEEDKLAILSPHSPDGCPFPSPAEA